MDVVSTAIRTRELVRLKWLVRDVDVGVDLGNGCYGFDSVEQVKARIIELEELLANAPKPWLDSTSGVIVVATKEGELS